MTVQNIFECDVCGDRHGHRNEIIQVEIRKTNTDIDQFLQAFSEPYVSKRHACIKHLYGKEYDILSEISWMGSREGYIAINDNRKLEGIVIDRGIIGEEVITTDSVDLNDDLHDLIIQMCNLNG